MDIDTHATIKRIGKIIAVVVLVIIVLTGLFLLPGIAKKIQSSNKKITATTDIKQDDQLSNLQTNNKLFAEGRQAAINGNYAEAVALLEKSKSGVTNIREKQVIDFAISDTTFSLSRSSGTKSFIELSKNYEYSNRFRALAMLRVYLQYKKYNDENVFNTIVESYGIKAKNSKQAVYMFMKQIFELYPFAFPAIYMVNSDLDSVKTKEEAGLVYSKYSSDIYKSIEELKSSVGEITETTSSMLAYASLLSKLYIHFDIGTKPEVEKVFEELVNYAQAKNVITNKQFALLYYADFESGAGDFQKAESVILLLLNEALRPAFKEALQNTTLSEQYPYLSKLQSSTKNEQIKSFIKSIGSKR